MTLLRARRRLGPHPATGRAVQMKMVVGYVESDAFEGIREELLALGFVSMSVSEASGSLPEPVVAGTYRGVTIERHLRPKARLECVVGDEHAQTIVDTVLRHAPERSFVFVVPVESAHPMATV